MVVGIISLLAGMILPALNQAKEKALQVKCLNRIKQLYLATVFYTQESDGYYPPLDMQEPIEWAYHYGSWMAPMAPYAGIDNFTSWRTKEASLYWCPETLPVWVWSYGFPHGCYAFNWRVRYVESGSAGDSHKVVQCRRPGEIFLLNEAGWYYADTVNRGFLSWAMINHPSPNIAPRRHKSLGMNFVWFDGHGRWMPYNNLALYWNNVVPESDLFGYKPASGSVLLQ